MSGYIHFDEEKLIIGGEISITGNGPDRDIIVQETVNGITKESFLPKGKPIGKQSEKQSEKQKVFRNGIWEDN